LYIAAALLKQNAMKAFGGDYAEKVNVYMKKKLLVTVVAIVLLAFVAFVVYKAPVHMLHKNGTKISYIEVFDGATGKAFTIDNKENVDYITANISSIALKRDGSSLGRMGYGFNMTLYSESGDKIGGFILNSEDAIRKDPFFYRDSTASLCYEYIENIERTIAP